MDMTVVTVGFLLLVLAVAGLIVWDATKKRKEAQRKEASRLKRSASAKAAAERRKSGMNVNGRDIPLQ